MRYLLLLLCIVEVLFVTWWQNICGPLVTPVLFLATSLGIGWVFLRATAQPYTATASLSLPPRILMAVQVVLFLVLSYFVFKTMKSIWWWNVTQDKGIDHSDIIGQLSCLAKRFLAGEQPYQTIQFSNYQLFPTYLPLQWLPYTATEVLHKDYRWVPTIGLWLASALFFIRQLRAGASSTQPLLMRLLLPVWPIAVWYTIIMYDNDVFKLTVESLIAGYYLFTADAINGRRVLPLAIGIAICLLSRYSIIFWVPLCVVCYLIANRRNDALIICGSIVAFFIVFYWFPFLRKDSSIFLQGYHYHTRAAFLEWQNDLNTLHGKFYLFNGYGFTSWAVSFFPGDLHHQLSVYQALHLVLCSLTVLALGVWYYFRRATISLQHMLLFSLKVYLAVFYAFIQIPYKYLYLTPVIITSALLANAFMHGRQRNSTLR